MNNNVQNTYHRQPRRGHHRFSLFENFQAGSNSYGSCRNTPTGSRNSSIEFATARVLAVEVATPSPKPVALTFSKRYSRRSVKSKESKENKSSETSIEPQGKGLFFSGTLPKRPTQMSKFAFESVQTSQVEDFSVSDLEKEL